MIFFSLSTFSTSKDRECEICNSCVPVSSRGIEKGRRKVSLFLRSKDCLWRGSSFFFFFDMDFAIFKNYKEGALVGG